MEKMWLRCDFIYRDKNVSGVCEMSNDIKLAEKVAKIEEKVSSVERRVDKLEDTTEILHKMEVLLQMQVESNEKQSEQMKRFEKTLLSVNDNLSLLNVNQSDMKEDISNISSRVEKVEEKQYEKSNRGKLDVMELTKDVIKYIIMAIIAYGLVKLGIG